MSEDPKPGRRRLQFSVRILLLLVAVVAILLGYHVSRVHKQRVVVAELGKLWSQVFYDYQTTFDQSWRRHVDPREPPQPAWVRRLLGDDFFADVTLVIVYDLPYYPVTDDTLVHISRLPKLRRLELVSPRITDRGISHLATLQELEEIDIFSSTVTDAGLLHLRSMPNLRILNIRDVQTSVEGLDRLRRALPDCHITVRDGPVNW